ncbi:MAG: hypothetical protein ACK56Q_17340, partial [Pirellulaceae bacterium]
ASLCTLAKNPPTGERKRDAARLICRPNVWLKVAVSCKPFVDFAAMVVARAMHRALASPSRTPPWGGASR